MIQTPATLIRNGTLVLPDQLLANGAVVIQNDLITFAGREDDLTSPVPHTVDAGGGYISPGFVDIHVHGGGGSDFMDGTTEAVRQATRTHARHGTTRIFPTTTTGTPSQLQEMLSACQQARQTWDITHGAAIEGVHFYGPYFAEEKAGCHRHDYTRAPDPAEYSAYFDQDIIRIATCAAELAGAHEFYRTAAAHHCLITCGHSNANWHEMERAFEAGMRHVDHFWCAMSSVTSLRSRFGAPYQAGMEQFVLAYPQMSTELIADGCHLSPELLEFALRIKGLDRLCLVTDASRALDQPPGRYRFGPDHDGEWFQSDGNVGHSTDGTGLASSVRGMDWMVRHMARATSAGLVGAVRMASLTPAGRAGLSDRLGSLSPGKRADLLILDADLQVRQVFIDGQLFPS